MSTVQAGTTMGSVEQASDAVIVEVVKALQKKDVGFDERVNEAFQVLSNGKNNVPDSKIHMILQRCGVKLTLEEVKETIDQVKAETKNEEVDINCEEFRSIIKLLKEPTVVEQLGRIHKTLEKGMVTEEGMVTEKGMVTLYGESGVGKTWMARKVADRAIRNGEYFAIWIYLNRIYEGLSLQESIAYQLSLLPAPDELEAIEDDDEAKEKRLEAMIHGEMEKKGRPLMEVHAEMKEDKHDLSLNDKRDMERKNMLLLILDDAGSKMEVHAEMKEDKHVLLLKDVGTREELADLYKVLALDKLEFKLLITRRKQPDGGELKIMVMPLTEDESKKIVVERLVGSVDGEMDEKKKLAEFFVGKSRRFPSEILIIAKTMSYFGLEKLRMDKEILEKSEKSCSVIQVLMSGYEVIPRSVLIDCYSSETDLARHFVHRRAMVDFNELISYWIMEGHLGQFDCIEDAYEEGHRVLMDLVDCGLLKKLEASYVMSNGETFDMDIHDCYEFFKSIHLGLSTTFDMKLGTTAVGDGMIRTMSNDQEGKKPIRTMSNGQEGKKSSTLLIDGNHIGGASDGFLDQKSELENLLIFDPTCKHFPLPITDMKKLCLLVLRGCKFLKSFEEAFRWTIPEVSQESQTLPPPQTSDPSPSHPPVPVPSNPSPPPAFILKKLTAFELSGPSFLETIPNNLFDHMPHLRNLNMSFLVIKSLPPSLYNLTELECLILRGCSSLTNIGSLKKSRQLQVLDISGATSIDNIQDKTFSENKKLQILNLSKSKIERLPLIHSLSDLKSLSLTDCASLLRIRKVGSLKHLQILDISGATKVEEFLDPSIEDLKSLVVLNVSGTAIRRLPSNISNPRYLYIRDCPRIKDLSPIEGLSKLEVLDLSGCCNLTEIKTEFFNNLKCVRELNLSKTGVKSLPFLSCLGKLRRLLLSECLSLEKLENLSSLEELELLDLSGCKGLVELEDKCFDKMKRLHTLNLSGLIQLDRLPSLSELNNLKELYVRNCPKLTNLPGLEKLSLKTLDHSGSTLISTHCHLENFDPQKLLKELGAENAEATSDKSESARLQDEQPNMDTETSNLQEKGLDRVNWSISNWQGEGEGKPNYVDGFCFLQLLKRYPSLLTNNLSRFRLLVHPTEEDKELPDYKTELSLRDIYLEQVSKQKLERCLEIRGFDDCPPFLGHLLTQAEFVFLIDSPFFRFLLDLGADNIKAMKALWIERCNELEHVIASGGVKDSHGNLENHFDNMEILWISDVMKMKSIYGGDIKSISFKNLKSLYLEYCPELSMICSSSSQLQNLEILYIKYCQKLKTPFTDGSAKLEKLTELHLWGLPELEKIAFKVPSLLTLRVGDCPLLRHLFSPDQGDGSQVEDHEKLETLHIKFCDKFRTICQSKQEFELSEEFRNIFQSQHKVSSAWLSELQKLELCDKLRSIFGSEQQIDAKAELRKVELWDKLKTRFQLLQELELCDKLKTVFQSQQHKDGKDWLPELQKVKLWDKLKGDLQDRQENDLCEKLRTILQPREYKDAESWLPELQKLGHWGKVKTALKPEQERELCGQLVTVFQSQRQRKDAKAMLLELQKLKLWCKLRSTLPARQEIDFCDKLMTRLQPRDHKDVTSWLPELQKLEQWNNLKTVLQPDQELELCDKLKTAFQRKRNGNDVPAHLPRLQKLELSGLPDLQRIACNAPSLDSLKVEECPLLQAVDIPDCENLKDLEVKYCDKLKTMFQGGVSALQQDGRVELLCLPELKSIEAKLPPLTRENCTIWGCSKELEETLLEGRNS